MWWLLALLAGCGGSRGPIEIPGPFEIRVKLPDEPCSHTYSEDADAGHGELVNRSGAPRLLEIVDLTETPEDVEALDSVVADADLDGDDPKEAALGDGVSVAFEAEAWADCDGGGWPAKGRYERDIPILSTDVLGGDLVEQALRVTVVVE